MVLQELGEILSTIKAEETEQTCVISHIALYENKNNVYDLTHSDQFNISYETVNTYFTERVCNTCFSNSEALDYNSLGIGLTDRIEKEIYTSGIPEDSVLFNFKDKMAKFLLSSRSDNTVLKYFNGFKRWERFANSYKLCAFPAQPIHIALYLTSLLDQGSSDSVISAIIYSVKWIHEINNLPNPCENGFVQNLLESAKRVASKITVKKEPVDATMLIELYEELSCLKCNDVIIHESYLPVRISKSKTDKYRKAGIDLSSDSFLFKPIFRSAYPDALFPKQILHTSGTGFQRPIAMQTI
ncbi:hypothetical protein KUTeg_017344 [Tegillarca granosa]|uniref:Uncharacterized protein n=1 Tax=Tegillarca granosa TaxID=220873 RepID=A0ABQ9EIJ2_TEGGR|nr:hypothetical protein KUTeg_017344 [Tegillarca granosa]